MNVRAILAVLVGSCAAWNPLAPAEETLRKASVFVEAEEFGPLSQVWRAGERWADDIYSPTSADGVLVNDGGGKEEVHKDITVPADGNYHVWVRYLKIGEYPGSFGLRITQNGQTVFDQEYRTHPKRTDWERQDHRGLLPVRSRETSEGRSRNVSDRVPQQAVRRARHG